jgi:hypothetical protein
MAYRKQAVTKNVCKRKSLSLLLLDIPILKKSQDRVREAE